MTVALGPDARRALATARVLSVALALASALYVLVAFVALGERQPRPPGERLLFTVVMLSLAAMGLLAAPFVRSAMIRRTDARGLPAWFVSVVVAQALREGAAVMGLVLSLSIGAAWPVVACAVAAVAEILRAFPREDDLAEHLRR